MNDEQVRQWIEEEYGIARLIIWDAMLENVLEDSDRDSFTGYGWMGESEIGIAYLRGGRLFRISRQDVENGPTFGQVVAGLGTPEMISRHVKSYGGHIVYTLGLDYPRLGVSREATGEMTARELSRSAGEWTVTLKEDMKVDFVFCYLPGLSMEEVLREVFFVSPENVSRQMRTRMPWPGFGALVPLEYAP